MGPLGAPRSRRKSSKRSDEARKATEKPPMGPRMPCWTHAARPPIGVFCHPASKTAQPPLPAKKSLLTLRAFNRYPPRRVKSVKRSVLLPEGNRERNQPSLANSSSIAPPKTPLRHGITAFSLNRKALAGPPLSPGQWAHGETGWWPFRGIGHARFLASKQ